MSDKTFRIFTENGYKLILDIDTGTLVFRQVVGESKVQLDANFEEIRKWLDWYENIHGATVKSCAEIARDFEWPNDSPMAGSEAERTAEAIANKIERLA